MKIKVKHVEGFLVMRCGRFGPRTFELFRMINQNREQQDSTTTVPITAGIDTGSLNAPS